MRYYKSMLEETLVLKQRIAYSGTSAQYIGYADPSVKETQALWLIVKLSYDGSGLMIEKDFADGSKAFDKIWTERTGYTYA